MPAKKELEIKHPSTLQRVRVHRSAPTRVLLFQAVFVALHAVCGQVCYQSSGQPYQVALEKLKQRNREYHQNGTKDEDKPVEEPLPSESAPNEWAAAALFFSISFHVFFYMLGHWRIGFRAWSSFRPADRVAEGCYLELVPHEHRGQSAIVKAKRAVVSGRLQVEFQRQRFEFWGEEDSELDDGTADRGPGELRLMECPVERPLPEYLTSRGLSEEDVGDLQERFGPNMLKVQTPSFMKCYREQLATPLVAFQFFIALLWAADDFLGYTLTQIVMILIFESTSVFQRINMLKTLNSMGTQAYTVKVYREKAWATISTADLLPGDLLQLTVDKDDDPAPPNGQSGGGAPSTAAGQGPSTDIVPCDCVILRGDCVANEATITGESVPQMKDAVPDEDRIYDFHGADRCHSLFSGSKLLRAGCGAATKPKDAEGANGTGGEGIEVGEGGESGEGENGSGIAGLGPLPETPDGGCLCFVLRTGFYSSQGELLQVIEFSRAKVTGDSKEIMVALLILTCFALVAAGYVLNKGLAEGERTPHELIVKCVIILTSVVPRGLPMQMSMAVNTALMSLMRSGVYCTEPFRVPVTGKVTHCLFDKTGTLTTDTLVPAGVVNVALADDGNGELVTLSTGGDWRVQEVRRASPRAAMVLAACHSLVADGRGDKLTGDPVEVASLQGVGWRYDVADATARPGNWAELDRKVESLRSELEKLEAATDAPTVKRREVQVKALHVAEAAAAAEKNRAAKAPTESVCILHRFHFASKLQRMSVIAELEDRVDGTADAPEGGAYVLVKGSPEALKPLLTEGSAPSWFDSAYVEMAEQGRRVLALAVRRLPESFSRVEADLKKVSREDMERDLRFVGFIAFECQIRADSKLVISALRDSGHAVAMITGDAALTALHVAKECGFCLEGKEALQLKMQDGGTKWVVAAGSLRGQPAPVESAAKLAESYSLAVTEDALEAADEAIWNDIDHIAIFARMTPNGKAKVIRSIQSRGGFVLMCGDGGNDAGALKQADAGIALLAGHGQVNTSDKVDVPVTDLASAPGGGVLVASQKSPEMGAEDALNARQQELAQRTKDVQKLRQQTMKQKQRELQVMQQKWLEEEVEARAQRGETGLMAQGAAVKTVLTRFTGELRREMREFDLQHGNVFDGSVNPETNDADPDANADDDDPMKGGPRKMELARPGDASVAAPFTSRQPSVKGCVDLIRQGRCTLLSALQQQQVMMMNAIINAFVLSVISLEGSRRSERQLLASDWLLTTASIAFSYATPVDKMHKVRPLRSLFHPAIFVSMLGQAAIHLGCLYYAVQMCREVMEDDSAARAAGWEGPSLVDIKAFWKKQRLIRRGIIEKEGAEEEDWYQQMMEMWFMPFLPNLMNTVIFLVETAQTVAVLTVNYKGQPWMKGVTENRALFFSLFLCGGSLIAAAWEFSPDINVMLHLSPFPNDAFRWKVMSLVGITLFGTYAWDRFCIAVFANEHFRAMVEAIKGTTFKDDIVPMLRCLMKVVAGFAALAVVGGLGQPPPVVAQLVTE